MADKSPIEWTDATWNPLIAESGGKRGWFCTHMSEGCRNCYAEAMNRYRGNGLEYKAQNRDKVTLKVEGNALIKPLSWRKPRMIFTNSMTDIFGVDFGVTFEMIDRVYAVMALTPHHTYQNLTKRPQARLEYMKADRRAKIVEQMVETWSAINGPALISRDEPFKKTHRQMFADMLKDWPLPNVWEGVSVEDQKTAEEREELLRHTPAAVRFISQEPQIAPIHRKTLDGIFWVIVGGESGPSARPFDLQWARDTIRQCREAGVSVFFKQAGSRPEIKRYAESDYGTEFFSRWGNKTLNFRDKKGGDLSELPEDLRVREWPAATQQKLREV